MIAALILPLGWWIIPVLVALVMAYFARRDLRGVSGGWAVLGWILYSVPALATSALYLLAALLFGIR